MNPDFATRFDGLLALLERHAGYWRPPPFRVERPDWCARQPALTAALLALDEATVDRLNADPAAAAHWLQPWLPELAELEILSTLPSVAAASTPDLSDAGYFSWRDIPGRKLAQIDAFASAVGQPVAPLLEACAGKGHLGRRMLAAFGGTAASLELDPRLCADGSALAARVGNAQHFIAGDIHAPEHAPLFRGHHVVALHACGDLHRRVLTCAVAERAPAIDLAPCCYQKTSFDRYPAFSGGGDGERIKELNIDRNLLQMAVTETVTASPREAKSSARQQAWKLAFVAWRGDYRPFMPVPAAWWRDNFAGFFHRLASREGCAVPTDADFVAIEAAGWQRWSLLQRLQLVRFAFRRALEVLLLLDMARWLEGQGYRVQLREFCRRELTPRNLLLSARLL